MREDAIKGASKTKEVTGGKRKDLYSPVYRLNLKKAGEVVRERGNAPTPQLKREALTRPPIRSSRFILGKKPGSGVR